MDDLAAQADVVMVAGSDIGAADGCGDDDGRLHAGAAHAHVATGALEDGEVDSADDGVGDGSRDTATSSGRRTPMPEGCEVGASCRNPVTGRR